MRYALRQLLRTPSFTAIAVTTLALGIAANTAIFAIVDELTFKPIRGTTYEDVHRVSVVNPKTGRSTNGLQVPDFLTLAATPPEGLAAIAGYQLDGGLIQIPGRAESASWLRVSADYAHVYRMRPLVGRWIDESDSADAGADVAVISERLWREWFKSAPDITERGTVSISTYSFENRRPRHVLKPLRIIGVAPPGLGGSRSLWVPLGSPKLLTREELARRKLTVQPSIWVVARVVENRDARHIADRMTAVISSRVETLDSPTGRIELTPVRGDDRLASTGYTILGFAALVFLGACANLANMLYARATEREGELAVRLSLGGSRFDIFRLLLNEALIICASGALAGIVLAWGALRLLVQAFPAFQADSGRRIMLDLSLNWRVCVYAAIAGIVAAAIVTMASVLRSGRVSLQTRLSSSGTAVVAKTEGRTLRTLLVSVQIATAVLFLIAAGIYLENSGRRFDRRLQFDTAPLVAARINLPWDYDESRGRHVLAKLLGRVRAIDGVTSAAVSSALPGGEDPAPNSGPGAIVAEADPRGLSGNPRRLDASWVYTSPGLPATLDLAVVSGRDLQATDVAGGPPVAVISESVGRTLWPGEDPVGKRISCCRTAYLSEVVGVVADPIESGNRSKFSKPGNFIFLPSSQQFDASMLILVRSERPLASIDAIRSAVVEIDSTIALFSLAPVDHSQFARAAAERAARVLAWALSVLALGIALLGVYAVVSYVVSRRSREFGLRLALGATRGQVVKLVVDHSIHMVLLGLLPGVLFASWGTRVFQVELVKLKPNGLAVWIAVPLLMLAAGIVAAYIPARRAAAVDPYRALKDN